MKEIGIGFAGFGGIGRLHQLAYHDIPYYYPEMLPPLVLKGVCASSQERSAAAAEAGGFPRAYADFQEMVEDPEISVIDIVSPNFLHREQILEALAAGKHVLCEKPLALNGAEALEIIKAADSSSGRLGMIFNYRFIPAIMKAKELIDAGGLGEIYSFRGEYFHTGYQNPARPFSWRMDFSRSGGGALADLGVHVIDLLRYLLGEFSEVNAKTRTFIEERPDPGSSGKNKAVTVDDAAWVHCSLKSGGKGSVEVSRFATGTLDDLNITIFGSKGSCRFSLMDPNFLYWFDADSQLGGWQRIETVQSYPGAKIPGSRSVVGWTRFHAENQYRFLRSIVEEVPFSPSVYDGAAAQSILDAAYESAESGKTVRVAQLR